MNTTRPVMNPKVRDTSADTITIAWTAPAFDSACEITGYVVEALEECTDELLLVANTPKVFAKFGVKRDTAYMLRVDSENAGGLSKFISVPGIVRPMEKLDKPESTVKIKPEVSRGKRKKTGSRNGKWAGLNGIESFRSDIRRPKIGMMLKSLY